MCCPLESIFSIFTQPIPSDVILNHLLMLSKAKTCVDLSTALVIILINPHFVVAGVEG